VAPAKHNALDVGGGMPSRPTTTFLAVDASGWPTDVAANAFCLPFRDGTFRFVNCSHVVEHVPYDEVGGLLRELRRVMYRDGVLYVAAPDTDRARAAGSIEWLLHSEVGGWRPEQEHAWSCTVPVLRHLLLAAGLVPTWATAVPDGWPTAANPWPADLEARFVCRRDDFPWSHWFPPTMHVIR
jgi:SAM-dependent methyltransferase